MPGRHRSSPSHVVAVVVGGALGALLRYALASTWPQPRHVFVATSVTAAVAFMVAGFLISVGVTSAVRAAVFGMCASAASLSAWAVLTISQTPKLSIAFLIGTPAAALAGLLCGLVTARVVAR